MHLNRLPNTESRLYHEAHITVEPHHSVSFEDFAAAVEPYDWRASKFEQDEVDHADSKWFLSAKHKSAGQLAANLRAMIQLLRDNEAVILRAKIEDTLFDTKYGDEL